MDLETFRKLAADRRVIPVSRRLLADGDTPVGLYRKLAAERPGTFLLESAENGRSWSRYSFIGVRSDATLTVRDGEAHWLGTPPVGVPTDGDPLQALRATVETLHTPRDLASGMPPFTGGMVGYLGYDIVRRLEKIGDSTRDDLELPELTMLLTSDLAVLDHWDGTVLLIANAINHNDLETGIEEAYAHAVARLDAMEADLARPVATVPTALPASELPEFSALWGGRPTRTPSRTSRSASAPTRPSRSSPRSGSRPPAPPPRSTSTGSCGPPTPPRTCTSSASRTASTSSDPAPRPSSRSRTGTRCSTPSCGTRHRGATPQEDHDLAEELLADPKERAEHLMLVDLGRNDLGRVCAPGSVEVVDFMSVERYSHVMHIVSTVTGEVAEGRTAFDVLTACFPAGTLSGAPKPRAMQIIEELEPSRRGLYGGCVGYLDFMRRRGHGHRHPYRPAPRRNRVCAGRSGCRRRLRSRRRGQRVP